MSARSTSCIPAEPCGELSIRGVQLARDPCSHGHSHEIIPRNSFTAKVLRAQLRKKLMQLWQAVHIQRTPVLIAKLALPGKDSALNRETEECFCFGNGQDFFDCPPRITHVVHKAHRNSVVILITDGIG